MILLLTFPISFVRCIGEMMIDDKLLAEFCRSLAEFPNFLIPFIFQIYPEGSLHRKFHHYS